MAQTEGYISQIIGPVIDVHFPELGNEHLLPNIHEEMIIHRPDGSYSDDYRRLTGEFYLKF